MTSSPKHALPEPSTERIDMADLADWATDRRVAKLAADPAGVSIVWDDGLKQRFHALWLRDNCACTACRHPQARERRFLLIDAPRPAVLGAGLTAGGNVEIRFAPSRGEPHLAVFDAGWLRRHGEGEALREPQRRLWDAGLAARLPTFAYDAVMSSPEGLARWLEAILEYGVALLRGAPAEPGEIRRIAALVQRHPRPTNFGDMYDVVSVPNPNASADTPMALEPHTDLANWRCPPDIQLLFCVANEAPGGDSVLVDGCRVAEELRVADPEAFRMLATYPVEFRFQDADVDIRYTGLTIETGGDARVSAVRFNNWLRSAFPLPQTPVEPMYRALLRLWSLLREERFQLRLKLDPGDMLAMNNLQVLHGRDAFDPNSGRRHLQGCYIDRELVLSRLRVLARAGSVSGARRDG